MKPNVLLIVPIVFFLVLGGSTSWLWSERTRLTKKIVQNFEHSQRQQSELRQNFEEKLVEMKGLWLSEQAFSSSYNTLTYAPSSTKGRENADVRCFQLGADITNIQEFPKVKELLSFPSVESIKLWCSYDSDLLVAFIAADQKIVFNRLSVFNDLTLVSSKRLDSRGSALGEISISLLKWFIFPEYQSSHEILFLIKEYTTNPGGRETVQAEYTYSWDLIKEPILIEYCNQTMEQNPSIYDGPVIRRGCSHVVTTNNPIYSR